MISIHVGECSSVSVLHSDIMHYNDINRKLITHTYHSASISKIFLASYQKSQLLVKAVGSFVFYTPMHEVTPKVVAMAVSTVMITCNTLLQISFFSMMCFDL